MTEKLRQATKRVRSRRAVVIGCSAGGLAALANLLEPLPRDFPAGIAVVNHLHPNSGVRQMVNHLHRRCQLEILEAEEKLPLLPGRVYLAPANYHLLLERGGIFALSIDSKIKYSRPAIDVLFESAADTFREKLIGIILTGASSDGTDGLAKIVELGGYAIVQAPDTAAAPLMPKSALHRCDVDRVLSPRGIGELLSASISDGELMM